MNQAEIVNKLRQLDSTNSAAHELFQAWAQRTRARTTVTVGAVAQMMKAKGSPHARSYYAKILSFLGEEAKVGTPIYTPRGHVAAITNVRYTLQSIAKTALGEAEELTGRKQSRMLPHIAVPQGTTPHKPVKAIERLAEAKEKRGAFVNSKKKSEEVVETLWQGGINPRSVKIGFPMKGKLVTIEVPRGTPGEDIATILHRLLDKNGETSQSN